MGPVSLISLCYASRIKLQLLGDRVQAKGGPVTTKGSQSELRVLRIVSGIDHSTCRSYPLVAAFPGLGSHTWNTNFAECEHLEDVFRCPTAKREPKVNTRKGGAARRFLRLRAWQEALWMRVISLRRLQNSISQVI